MKYIHIRSAILLAFFSFILALPSFAQINTRDGEVWRPAEVNGERVITTNAYLEITSGQRKFTGNTGCNVMFGRVSLGSRHSIDLSNVITTRRACKLMGGSLPEETFLSALDDAVRYSRNGRTLDLFNKRGKRVIRFVSSPKGQTGDPTTNAGGLTDRKWFLESIAGRKTFVAIKGVFVNFTAETGSAGGDTGCNVFGGSYTAGKRDIAITDIISTMRACVEDGKMQIEREFLDGLRNSNRYDIRDGRLHLYRRNELLLTLRGEPK